MIVKRHDEAFDYHGFTPWSRLWEHFQRRNRVRWSGWSAELVALPQPVLVAGLESHSHAGLFLRGPHEFLHDPLPRAFRWLAGFPSPQGR